jgi:hypothetical protein
MSDDGARPFRKDMFSDAFESHPMAAEIKRLAAENEVDLTDVSALSTVLEILDGGEHSDPRQILICALLLERLIHHKEEISIRRLMETPDLNTSDDEEQE